MAEANNQKRKISVGTWIALALALVLIVEMCAVGVNIVGAFKAKSLIDLNHDEDDLFVEGVSLRVYELNEDFEVDHEFLVSLMALSKQDINVVHLPVDVSNHVTLDGSKVGMDGEWLWHIASLAEMIFQSEYQVILSLVVPEDMKITPEAYESMWKQMNEAFGHRPASELWYDLSVTEYQQGTAWDSARSSIIAAMRGTNPERQIMLTLPEAGIGEYLAAAENLCERYQVHLGALATKDVNADILEKVGEITIQNNVTAIMIEPEGAAEGFVKSIATANGFGYLLQGD